MLSGSCWSSRQQWTASPALVVVAARISRTITAWESKGFAAPVFEWMKAKRRCGSMRFHLLVPGGWWVTVIDSPD